MGFWTDLASSLNPRRVLGPYVMPKSPDPGLSLRSPELARVLSPARLWRTQPHLRTVVSFRARNVAQLGLHCYVRTEDGSRERDRDSVLARTLQTVDGTMTTYELIYALVGDFDLYDSAYWLVAKSVESPTGWVIRRLPVPWMDEVRSTPFTVDGYRVHMDGRTTFVDAAQVLRFPGFDPGSTDGVSSAVEALRGNLMEQIESASYRRQLWERGGRVSSVIERPADADPWSDAAREAFREDWYAKYTGNGSRAGGTPILEDGMKLTRIDFSAQDQQYVEAAKLSLQTVASAYHVEPSMVGMGDGATYSNMRAFRKMLYTETLGPLLAQIEARINTFLVPMLGLDSDRHYVEFNIAEKLQGDFEEQASVLSTSTGRPWMTANEARSRQNLPALPGGDDLVIPLNVLIGGQAAPTDSGTQNEVPDPVEEDRPKALKADRVAMKARPDQPHIDKHTQVLADFFARQRAVTRSRLGAKDDGWWDTERWDNELGGDLLALAVATATDAAVATLTAVSDDPDAYDEDRTIAFLREASRRNAANINATTKAQLDDAYATDALDGVDHVFDVAESARAAQAAATLATFAAGFGSLEAARQRSTGATKTWVVTSTNPRKSHARMDGETVGVDEDFSNGLAWPGASGDADEVAGCTCDMKIRF